MISCENCEYIHKYRSVKVNKYFLARMYSYVCLYKIKLALIRHSKKSHAFIVSFERKKCKYYKPKTQMEIKEYALAS